MFDKIMKCRVMSVVIFLTCATASADEFHYNNMLIGDRASGLGGAYVAISDDPAGLYYNPAGVVYAVSDITASMNAYNVTVTRYKSVLNGKDWERTSTALLPNFFGITQKLGPGVFGFSYAVTDSIQEDQAQTFSDVPIVGSEYSVNFNNLDTTTIFGPTYAVSVSNKLSIGLSLFSHIRSQELVINQLFEFADETILVDNISTTRDLFHSDNRYVSLLEYGIKPVLGIMYSPVDSISLGLSISDTFLVSSNYEEQKTILSNFTCDDTNKNLSQQCIHTGLINLRNKNENTRHIPWSLNFGIVYFAHSKLMLTSSFWVHEPVNGEVQPLINAAVGLEYYITGKFAVRMGAYTNFSNTPEINSAKDVDADEHIDILGATLSLSHFSRTAALTLGFAGTYGSGQAQILDDDKTQDIEYYGVSVFLSGTNSF